MKKVTVEGEPIIVSYKLGATLNTGNYESLRVDFGLSIPCSEKSLTKTIAQVKKQVEAEMDIEVKRLRKMVSNA